MGVTKSDCIRIARDACRLAGWPWVEPVIVRRGVFSWTVITNAESIGSNVRIVVRKKDGHITKQSFAPR